MMAEVLIHARELTARNATLPVSTQSKAESCTESNPGDIERRADATVFDAVHGTSMRAVHAVVLGEAAGVHIWTPIGQKQRGSV